MTSAGRRGAGAFLFHGCCSSQSRTNCLSNEGGLIPVLQIAQGLYGYLPDEVNLVLHEHTLYALRNSRQQLPVLRPHAGARIDKQQHQICSTYFAPGTSDAQALNLILRITQPGGVNNVKRHIVNVDRLPYAVACSAGDVRDNGELFSREPVQ